MATKKKKKKIEKDRSSYMGREYTLYVSATGAVFIREKGDVLGVEGFLPFFSAETHEAADMLRVRHCRLSRTGPQIYILNDFIKDSLDCVNTAADAFAKTYEEFTSKNPLSVALDELQVLADVEAVGLAHLDQEREAGLLEGPCLPLLGGALPEGA